MNSLLLYINIVYNYCIGYFLLKGGIRKSNIDYFLTGKDIVGHLFFAGNHPWYRKLYLYMDFDVSLMPEYMWNEFSGYIGVRVDGKGLDEDETGLGEHFDFCVENINKKLKASLNWAPTNIAWLVACRTYDFYIALTKKLLKWTSIVR